MSSAYRRNDKEFQKRMAAIAAKRDADRAYYEQLIGRPLVQEEAERSAYAWRVARIGPLVVLALMGAALLVAMIWKAL